MYGNLSKARYDEIEALVVDTFEECDIHTYPIDAFFMVEKLHYILVPYTTLAKEELLKALETSNDGYSKVEENPFTGLYQYVIYYNDMVSWGPRIIFTLLHEIGHCILGHHDNQDDSLSSIEEEEANHFAKYAIAPPPLIWLAECQNAEDIVATFHTSAEAGAYCYDFFRKWCNVPGRKPYETKLVELFYPAA